MENKIIEVLAYTLPSVVTGLIAYYFFNMHTKNEEGRRRFILKKETQKNALPLRLQAYERMSLFLERINPTKLFIRVQPDSPEKNDYEALLIASIETEFDHNLAQQIYMTDECWNIVRAAKNATIQLIRKASMQAESPEKIREIILSDMLDRQPPSNAALNFIKKEVSDMW